MVRLPLRAAEGHELRRLETPTVPELEELVAVQADLEVAVDAVEFLVERAACPGEPPPASAAMDQLKLLACMDCAAIRYRRAEAALDNLKSQPGWMRGRVPRSLASTRKWILSLANQHIAHSESPRQLPFVLGVIERRDEKARVRLVHAMVKTFILANRPRLEKLLELFKAARAAIDQEHDAALRSVAAEARLLSTAEIDSLLPIGPSARDPRERRPKRDRKTRSK